VAQTVL
jgi:hypothetical protein